MSLVEHRLTSGLFVASQASDEASVRRALKAHDPDLALTPDVDDETGQIVWTVMKRVGEQRYIVCRWRDETHPDRTPLPLSHGLVEHVKRLDLNSRAPRIDVQAENDRLQASQREAADEEIEWYSAELVDRLRGRTLRPSPRGQRRRGAQFPNLTDIR